MERCGVHCRLLHPASCRTDFLSNISYYAKQSDDGAQHRVEFLQGDFGPGLQYHPDDRFMACRADSVSILAPYQNALNGRPMFYFIQDDERVHPEAHGGNVAAASYDHPHIALFSTPMLAQFFRDHKIGVFREGAQSKLFWIHQPAVPLPDPGALGSWQNLWSPVEPSADAGRVTKKKRMVVYWRPGIKRNLGPAILLALSGLANNGH
jgi:hypothetical protein